eukprot:10750391-Alexandrium_andersonii.AAC.1
MPSIDCLLARARMAYLARLVWHRPPALLAILRARPRGRRSPWLDIIIGDMRRMTELVDRCAWLPDPEQFPPACIERMR